MSVKSVYNFVPAPTEAQVFKPDWAEQVNHDIPFSDGESGEIELTITAKTPIFIRNGYSKDDAKNNTERYLDFSNVVRDGKKEYFIPGSSLKGMFRNVLEIMSRSRLSQLDNHRHAIRQIMATKDTVVDEGYDLKDDKKNIHAGWLIYQDGKHYIYDCGKPYKIRYTDLDNKGFQFKNHFKRGGKASLSNDFSARTARYKYENLKIDFNKVYSFEGHPLDDNDKQKSWVSVFQPLHYVRFSDNIYESFRGHIVCVGQASDYSVDTSRKGEYIFKGNKQDIIQNERKRLCVSKDIFNDFLFVNRHNKSDELEDWSYLKKKINSGIPVFFRKENDKKEVKDFGIPFMYKQPARYSVKQLLDYKYEKGKDLTELIFGSISRKDDELKGRVFVSHMKCESSLQENDLKVHNLILGGPRSSYFPFYLKQRGNNGRVYSYNSYNNKSKLAGYKRYPVRNNINYPVDLEGANMDMVSNFYPLPDGTVFKGKLRFHNLRKVEIGALFSSISFHNTKNAKHSLGYAKPFGFGKVVVKANQTNSLKFSIEEYLREFELTLKKHDLNWDYSSLVSMAVEMQNEENLIYPNLSDFQTYKNDGNYLEPYNNFVGENYFYSYDEITLLKETEQKLKDEEESRIKQETKPLCTGSA